MNSDRMFWAFSIVILFSILAIPVMRVFGLDDLEVARMVTGYMVGVAATLVVLGIFWRD